MTIEPPPAPGASKPPDPVSRQGFDRQRLVPQDERPADVLMKYPSVEGFSAGAHWSVTQLD